MIQWTDELKKQYRTAITISVSIFIMAPIIYLPIVFVFLKDKLRLPINRQKSGIRRPSNFELLGHGFAPIYKKGVKGKYQLPFIKT